MLNRQTYFIREHIGLLKMNNTYDILDPVTQVQIGIAQEKPGFLVTLLRLFIDRHTLPTTLYIYEGNNPDDNARLQFSIHRGIAFFGTKIRIRDPRGQILGWFVTKLLSLGGALRVFNTAAQEVAQVKGDWKGGTFRFLGNGEQEIGVVSKKWGGIGKELFTTADNYVISLNSEPTPENATLLLAAGLTVDMVFKE